jgi:hypothetical protein
LILTPAVFPRPRGVTHPPAYFVRASFEPRTK